jgi:hypothetical protein
MTMRILSLPSLQLLLVGAIVLGTGHATPAQARTFTFVNKCNETVWVGSLGNPGHAPPNGGGWAVGPGGSTAVSLPGDWAGRFWGRRNCNFNSAGQGTCETGDCGGRLQCNGAGGVPPTSLAEFTLGGLDYYDVSLVDGYDFPIQISPSPANTSPSNPYQCGSPTCTTDLLSICPPELQKRNGAGRVVACMSACEAFNTDQYCCRGAFNTPATCKSSAWPVNYPAIFKRACPTQYSYAYDDNSSTYVCNNPSPDYTLTFCPGGGSNPPPSTGISSTAWYNIINQNNQFCVDDAEWGNVDGAKVQQYGCGNNQANQQWQFQPTDSGYYKIVSRFTPRVIDSSGGPSNTGNGAPILLWPYWGGTNQQWLPVALGGGYYKFVARHSGRCLDVPGASKALGVQLQQYDCNGTFAQSFFLQQR